MSYILDSSYISNLVVSHVSWFTPLDMFCQYVCEFNVKSKHIQKLSFKDVRRILNKMYSLFLFCACRQNTQIHTPSYATLPLKNSPGFGCYHKILWLAYWLSEKLTQKCHELSCPQYLFFNMPFLMNFCHLGKCSRVYDNISYLELFKQWSEVTGKRSQKWSCGGGIEIM